MVNRMTLTFRLREEIQLTGEFIVLQPDISEEEFYSFADEDIKCELINGVLVIHSPATTEHEDLFGYLYTLLRLYLDETGEGKIFGSRLAMRLSPKWSPEPDILVILPKKYHNLQEGRLEGPADIVIEILSKSTREIDLEKKLPSYLDFGVREVWIIDPEKKSISIHSKSEIKEWNSINKKDRVRSVVLPKFFVYFHWLWKREEFKPGKVIQLILSKQDQ